MAERVSRVNIVVEGTDNTSAMVDSVRRGMRSISGEAARASKSASGVWGGGLLEKAGVTATGRDPFEQKVRDTIAGRIRAMSREAERAKLDEEVQRRMFGLGGVGEGNVKAQAAADKAAAEAGHIHDNALAKLFRGTRFGRVASFGTRGAIVGATDIAGRMAASWTEQIAQMTDAMRSGETTAGEFTEKLAGMLPVLGGWYRTGRNIREILTGEEQAERQHIERMKELTAAIDRQAKSLRESRDRWKDWEKSVSEAQREAYIAGLRPENQTTEQTRLSREDQKKAIQADADAREKEAQATYDAVVKSAESGAVILQAQATRDTIIRTTREQAHQTIARLQAAWDEEDRQKENERHERQITDQQQHEQNLLKIKADADREARRLRTGQEDDEREQLKRDAVEKEALAREAQRKAIMGNEEDRRAAIRARAMAEAYTYRADVVGQAMDVRDARDAAEKAAEKQVDADTKLRGVMRDLVVDSGRLTADEIRRLDITEKYVQRRKELAQIVADQSLTSEQRSDAQRMLDLLPSIEQAAAAAKAGQSIPLAGVARLTEAAYSTGLAERAMSTARNPVEENTRVTADAVKQLPSLIREVIAKLSPVPVAN